MPKRNLAYILLVLLAAVACYYFLPDRRTTVLQPFLEAYNCVDRNYVQPLSERQRHHFLDLYSRLDAKAAEAMDEPGRRQYIESAIQSMIAELGDPYSEYLPPTAADEYAGDLQGRFTGIGVELEMRDGRVTVITPVEFSPAFAAGIMPGDCITRVADQSVEQMSTAEVARLIRGQPGSEVTLAVRRPGVSQPLLFTLTRTRITRNPVSGFRPAGRAGQDESSGPSGPGGAGEWDYLIGPPLADNLGYIRVSEFVDGPDSSTMARFNSALSQLQSAAVRGLIIDLRNNPGGIFNQAIQMVSRFVAEGVIVTERGTHGEEAYRTIAQGTLTDLPIVVLINEGSASASEIVAGSLAIHSRAVLVGQRSYGKATKQETIQLAGVGGGKAKLKLTTAYLYLPYGGPKGMTFDCNPPRDPDDPGLLALPSPPAPASQAERPGGIKPTVTVPMSAAEQLAMIHCRLKMDALATTGPTTQPERAIRPAARSAARLVKFDPRRPTTAPDWSAATPAATPPPTTGPVTMDDWAEELVRVNPQLATAIAILSDPPRYRSLLRKAPTTAAEVP